MLNDFTGQSEALVGVLDPFWQSKGIVGADEVRRWNAPTVALARFDRYTWTSDQSFSATVEVSHFGSRDLPAVRAAWSLTTQEGDPGAQGEIGPIDVPAGGHPFRSHRGTAVEADAGDDDDAAGSARRV